MTIEEVLAKDEKQVFDRKSINIKPVDLSDTICAFANADGGTVVIGISDKHRRIEGVDRMCKELESVGLPDPVFNNSTFILKTVVMSASAQKLPISTEKVADSAQKLPISMGKVADLNQNGNIESKKLPLKISIESVKNAYSDKGYNSPTISKLLEIYNQIEANQVFGTAYIVKTLDCSERTARNLLSKLKDMDVIVAVSGKGKGMYRFKYTSEI